MCFHWLRKSLQDKVQLGNLKKNQTSPSEMRMARGNDPITTIQQLQASSHILSIARLSKSHTKQHEGKNICSSLKIDCGDRGRRFSLERRVREKRENLLGALMVRAITCFYGLFACSDWRFLSIPRSVRCRAAFHQVASILRFLPRCLSSLCAYNSACLSQPAPCRFSLPSNFLLSLLSRTFILLRIHLQYLSIFTACSASC